MTSITTDRLQGASASKAVKAPVVVASTGANLTLSGEQTIDGIAVTSTGRVLVKDQTTASENGIYNVNTSTWQRAPDFDGANDAVPGTQVYVQRGTHNADTQWVFNASSTDVDIEIGTDDVVLTRTGPTDASGVGYTGNQTGAVERFLDTILNERVNVKNYGAVGDGVTDDAAAIRAAIAAAEASLLAGSSGIYQSGVSVGTAPEVYFPPGVYKVSSNLSNDSNQDINYLRFVGDDAIISLDAGVNGFLGIGFDVQFSGLQFRGGSTAIGIKTANVNSSFIVIDQCHFDGQTAACIHLDATSQSTILNITNTKIFQKSASGKALDIQSGDMVNMTDCWLQASVVSVIENRGQLHMTNCLLVPEPTSNLTSLNGHWIANYGAVVCKNVRFGGEGSGAPPIYNFADLQDTTTAPFIDLKYIILEDCWVYNGSSGRADRGIIVAKDGLPSIIRITGCQGAAAGFVINDQFASGDLATWLSTLDGGGSFPSLDIHVDNNTFGNSYEGLVTPTSNLAELRKYMTYGFADAGADDDANKTLFLPYVDAQAHLTRYGLAYLETTSSGADIIVDTGLYFGSARQGYDRGSLYEAVIRGNPNPAGSANYRSVHRGDVTIYTTANSGVKQEIAYSEITNVNSTGAGILTIAAKFWNGSSETTSIADGSTTYQIRLRVTGSTTADPDFKARLSKVLD